MDPFYTRFFRPRETRWAACCGPLEGGHLPGSPGASLRGSTRKPHALTWIPAALVEATSVLASGASSEKRQRAPRRVDFLDGEHPRALRGARCHVVVPNQTTRASAVEARIRFGANRLTWRLHSFQASRFQQSSTGPRGGLPVIGTPSWRRPVDMTARAQRAGVTAVIERRPPALETASTRAALPEAPSKSAALVHPSGAKKWRSIDGITPRQVPKL
jgi:hypothetical protein